MTPDEPPHPMTHPERVEEITPLYSKDECDADLAESMAILGAHRCSMRVAHAINVVNSMVSHLRFAITASEKRAETARDDALEEAAKVAAAHDADQGIKKLGPSNFRMASEEARMAMRDEARGERIASEMIAKAIRAMKGQC